MRIFCCILFFIILKFSLQAQQLLIVDSSAAPVAATVEAFNLKDHSKVKGVAENGKFVLPGTGTFNIRIHALGFEDYKGTHIITLIEPVLIVLESNAKVIEDIVVTGELGRKTPKNAVIPIKVIDSKKIALMGAQNLRDVLTNEAGIRISQDNILGSSISMQGISGENVKILIDGVPIIGRQNGNIDLSQIDMSNVERIEVIEGPMSVNYGTNALGGVINIITKKGSTQKNSLALKTYYESIGTYNTGIIANTHIKKVSIQATASRNFFDGWSTTDKYEAFPIKHLADTNRLKTWKPKTQYNAGINLGYKFKNWDFKSRTVAFDESILNRGIPRAPYFEDAFDDIYHTRRFDNTLQANYSKAATTFSNTQLSYNYYKRIKNTYYSDLTTLEKQLSTNIGDQDTSKFALLNLRSTYLSTFKKINYETGIDINIESASGLRFKNSRQSISDYALFAVGEYSLNSALTIRGGLRGAYNTNYHAPVLPSFNAKWYINPRNVIRASFSEGFKSPSLKELYFYFVDFNHDIVGNTNLKAETSKSVNLQYNFTTMLGKKLLKIETKAFYNHINNLITLAQLQGLSYTYVNIGVYKTTGLQTIGDITLGNLKINAGVNIVGRYNQLASNAQVAKFNFSPEYITSLSYQITRFYTHINLYYKFNGKLQTYVLNSQNNLEIQDVGSYHWADASITQPFSKTFSVGAGVKNIFNVQNIQTSTGTGFHQTGNQMPIGAGRFYFFSINYLLQK